jgi:outer membrane protein assembly factor BamB
LSTGDASYLFDPSDLNAKGTWPRPLYRATIKADRAAAPFGTMRNVLSTSEGFVYGRLGSEVTRKRSAAPVGDQAPGVIVAHDAARGGVLLPGFPLAPGLEEEFDGPPLVREERMFVAIRKRDEMRTQLLVRCIDVASVKTIWERSICNAETRGRGVRDEASQTALLLEGERLYVAPHLGCVACLGATSGGIRWLTKYPRADFPANDSREASRWQRGLGAMHLRGDSLVILAADCERVFALDGISGKLKWASRRELMNDAVYVLGATEEEVVLTGESVYWLDPANGQVKACYPERWVNLGQDRIDPHSAYGRGIWAGDSVWYPARDAILKVTLAPNGKVHVTSELPLPQKPSPFGNLAHLNGRLYWASEDCVMAWNSPAEKLTTKKPLGESK